MTLEPFYLEDEQRRLFGAYHPPAEGLSRDTAVLFVAPLGQEYDLTYLTLVKLSEMLAAQGFPVLRFDHRGTGDSSGDFASATLAHWQADVAFARQDLMKRSGASKVCLLGLRLGGSLAYLEAVADPVDALVLWSPVKNGQAYWRELQKRHRLWLKRVTIQAEPPEQVDPAIVAECLGFRFCQEMQEQLQALDLTTTEPSVSGKVLLCDGPFRGTVEQAFAAQLEQASAEWTVRHPEDTSFWSELGAVTPEEDLQAISQWIGQSCP